MNLFKNSRRLNFCGVKLASALIAQIIYINANFIIILLSSLGNNFFFFLELTRRKLN